MSDFYPVIESLLAWLFEISLHAAVLVLLVLAIQKALTRWLTVRWRYALWGLVVLRLIVPALPSSDFSALNLLAMGETEASELVEIEAAASLDIEEVAFVSQPELEFGVGAIQESNADWMKESTASSLSIWDKAKKLGWAWWAGLIWLAGVIVVGGWILIAHVRFSRKMQRDGIEAPAEAATLLAACMDEWEIKSGRVKLLQTDAVNGPALMGVLHPRILMPAHLLKSLSQKELRFVLMHELTHYRCKDVAANWLLLSLAAIHWFNPLIWLGFYRLRCDREALRDAMVLQRSEGSESKAYGLALVHVLETGPRLSVCPALAGVAGSPNEMKRRVQLIADFAQTVARWKQVLGIALLIVLGCVGLTGAKVGDADSEKRDADASAVLLEDAGSIAPLVGKLAPELVGIQGWKNSQPLQLNDLRGGYVLLDFFGSIQRVRELMALSEMFPQGELAMVGVHNTWLGSLEELDERLAVVRDKFLMGRKVNYPIALDGAGAVELPKDRIPGATHERYGVTGYATTVLIDPEGIVLGRFHRPSLDELVEGVEKLLGVKAKKPNWLKRFEDVYALEPDEVLRYVPEPYVKERKDFYYAEYTRRGLLDSRRSEKYPTDEPKSSMFRWHEENERLTREGLFPGPMRILAVLKEFGYDDRDFENKDDLMAPVAPGDWVMREGADRAALLKAFETILNDKLEMPIHFEPIKVQHDVYVATGDFKFAPLGGAYGNEQIHMFTAEPDLAEDINGGGGSGDLSHMLDYAGQLGGVRIKNQATSNLDKDLIYRQHSSTRGLRNQANSADFEKLLESISNQTGLVFKKELRKGEVLRVVEETRARAGEREVSEGLGKQIVGRWGSSFMIKVRHTFFADGRYLIEAINSPDMPDFVGTWEIDDDSLTRRFDGRELVSQVIEMNGDSFRSKTSNNAIKFRRLEAGEKWR